jgi:hypothetical protein
MVMLGRDRVRPDPKLPAAELGVALHTEHSRWRLELWRLKVAKVERAKEVPTCTHPDNSFEGVGAKRMPESLVGMMDHLLVRVLLMLRVSLWLGR